MDGIVVGIGIVTLLFLFLLVGIVIALFLQLRKLQSNKGGVSEIAPQIAVLGEKLSHIEPVVQGINSVQTDLRGLTERISSVEQNQSVANQGVGNFATNALSAMTELKTLTTNLSDATGAMRTELSHAKND